MFLILQVEDVYAMFGDLDKLKDNNWQLEKPKLKKVKKVVKVQVPAHIIC